MSDQIDLLREFIALLHRSTQRLELIAAELQPVMPLRPEQLAGLDHPVLLRLEALMKKLEQFVEDFRCATRLLLNVVGERTAGLNQRQQLDRLESLGVIASAADIMELIALRSRATHEYPSQPAKQAELLNGAIGAVPAMVAALGRLEAYARANDLLSG